NVRVWARRLEPPDDPAIEGALPRTFRGTDGDAIRRRTVAVLVRRVRHEQPQRIFLPLVQLELLSGFGFIAGTEDFLDERDRVAPPSDDAVVGGHSVQVLADGAGSRAQMVTMPSAGPILASMAPRRTLPVVGAAP